MVVGVVILDGQEGMWWFHAREVMRGSKVGRAFELWVVLVAQMAMGLEWVWFQGGIELISSKCGRRMTSGIVRNGHCLGSSV